MRKIHPNNPHFFQPLLPNYLHNFSIPKSFIKNLGELRSKQEKKAKLRNKKGRSWYVKLVISTTNNGIVRAQFKDGWTKFCKDNDLEVGDFLVFKHHGNFVFDVFIFDPTTCERQLTKKLTNSRVSKKIKGEAIRMEDAEDERMKGSTTFDIESSNYPFYRTVVKPYWFNWSGMPLPREFAEENGLSKRWCDMELIDEQGRSWAMLLRYHKYDGMPYIGSWRKFHKAMELKTGDAVIVQLICSGEKPIMKFFNI